MNSKKTMRFYDNRQNYLAFVNTCNEKRKVGERVSQELPFIQPQPPAIRIFDAGMGDGTVLSHIIRSSHCHYPTLPLYVVGKEISLEDIRLSMEKLPDRFVEHPASVMIFTNLNYTEAPWLTPRDSEKAANINWKVVELDGDCSSVYDQQLGRLDDFLIDGWKVTSSKKTGNPLYKKPTVLVIYRKDHKFQLNSIIPDQHNPQADYDLIVASQPWRARVDAEFKVKHVLSPLVRALRASGRLVAVQSCGLDPALEIIQEIWPEEDPFQVNRHQLLATLEQHLGDQAEHYELNVNADLHGLFQYQMHTLPGEIAASIGTSTLFAAWNAAVYVAQIENHRLEEALNSPKYLDATSRILRKHNGLWFNDESFVVAKK